MTKKTPYTAFEQQVANHLNSEKLWNEGDQLYVACSGGMDSVVLVHLLRSLGASATILHCNFQLRGEESDRDQAFVEALAVQLGWPFRSVQFNTKDEVRKSGKSIQEIARKLRYDWFAEVLQASEGQSSFVLTAHHANDVAETVMINFLRGTGIKGLHGIPSRTGRIVRPLLPFKREALQEYAMQKQITWVEDSSNEKSEYTRNLIRNEVLPLVQTVFPQVVDNLLDNVKRLKEVESIYTTAISQQIQACTKVRENETAFAVNALKRLQPLDTYLYEAFVEFGFTSRQTPELKKLLDAPTGKFICSSSHRVLKNRNWLLVHPLEEVSQPVVVIESIPYSITTASYSLSIEACSLKDADISRQQKEEYLSASGIEFPLLVRSWKAGDYFYPLGMPKKKKVARFLTDLKVSLHEKQHQFVLESNQKIIAVLGKRIDDRFKLLPTAQTALKISFKAHSE